MFKAAIAAIAALALCAGFIVIVLGISPQVAASAPQRVTKADRLDIQTYGPTCSQRAWPYYEPDCLRKTEASARPIVRVVSIDQLRLIGVGAR
jgi:hypothetical protein